MSKVALRGFMTVACTVDDAGVREALRRAFDGYSAEESDGDVDDRESALHALGVEVDTPFSIHREWSVESAETTSDGFFRLSLEAEGGLPDGFAESFLLVTDGVGAVDITADLLGVAAGDPSHLVVIDGAVISEDDPDAPDDGDDLDFSLDD